MITILQEIEMAGIWIAPKTAEWTTLFQKEEIIYVNVWIQNIIHPLPKFLTSKPAESYWRLLSGSANIL